MMITSFLLFASFVHAGGDVVTLKKGQHAPFDGTLFSTDAAAAIAVQLENQDKRCRLQIEEALKKQKVKKDYEISIVKIQKDEQKKRCDEIIKIKSETLDKLYDKPYLHNKSWKNSLWFTGGVVAGIGITAISAWSLSQVAK
mgnify:CR=1 FL=1